LRKLALTLAAAAAVAVPVAVSTSTTSSAERHCYTPHVPGFDTYEVCYFLPIEPTTVAGAGPIWVPNPTDCHDVQRLFGVANVVSCSGPPSS
jgi:hypothetical protein